MELEITPDIIIRHGDPIAISYSNWINVGLFRSYGNTLQYYDLLTRPQAPNGLGKYYNKEFINNYMDSLRQGKGPRQSYIYGNSIKDRVLPISMDIYKGTRLYEEYELVKRIINEH